MSNQTKNSASSNASGVHSGNAYTRKRRRKLYWAGTALILTILFISWQYFYIESTSPMLIALLNFNAIILLFLVFLILKNLTKLYVENSHQHAGSKFRNKLVLAFFTLTLVPSCLLAFAGTNLMATAIRNWFDPKVEQFLENVMDVARLSYETNLSFLEQTAPKIINKFAESEPFRAGGTDTERIDTVAEEIIAHFTINTVQLFNVSGVEVGRASDSDYRSGMYFESANPLIARVLGGERVTHSASVGTHEIVYYGFPLRIDAGSPVAGAIFIGLRFTGTLSNRIWNIQNNYEKYLQQKQNLKPATGLYVSIYLMISLTILLAALWVSFYFARQISDPIYHLSRATNELAKGNYDYQLVIQAPDEIGELVRSFNSMTLDIRESRRIIDKTTSALHQRNREIETRRNELEIILSTIKSGVIALDVDGSVRLINSAACGFTSVSIHETIDIHYSRAFQKRHLKSIMDILDRMYIDRYKVFQNEIQIESEMRLSTFSVNATPLHGSNQEFNGVVIVLNDLTQLLRIQRIAAWREVARRLAHEIKNPLTPIQLNTQRMQKKFREKSDDFKEVFENATASIINEVSGLRTMLNEFSQLAQMPEVSLKKGDIHEIILQTAELYAGKPDVRIELKLEKSIPPVMLDVSQIKRVFINLIDNAIHAMDDRGMVVIKTGYDAIFEKVCIEVMDHGPGVPSHEKNRLFLPYFSTKRDGSGLGLAICSRIITDHGGSIRVTDNDPHGARFIIELPVISYFSSRFSESGMT